jgi:hypothetical protein
MTERTAICPTHHIERESMCIYLRIRAEFIAQKRSSL